MNRPWVPSNVLYEKSVGAGEEDCPNTLTVRGKAVPTPALTTQLSAVWDHTVTGLHATSPIHTRTLPPMLFACGGPKLVPLTLSSKPPVVGKASAASTAPFVSIAGTKDVTVGTA